MTISGVLGNADDKASLMFDMYDFHGTGKLSKNDFRSMLRSVKLVFHVHADCRRQVTYPMVRRDRVIKVLAVHFSRTHARSRGSSLTTARTRSIQPFIPTVSINQVPASAGVMAGSSPLSGGM